ncbi:MAG: YbhB/YbcL family Raf kinase inhibitor-like protein [Myxococcales bacterium]|nr:YbhB/YbcL family Raf kinase inhibitor-like protein [Myxococcales bacterium]
MLLTSTAFREGGAIPSQYTQDGVDLSPPLAWRDVPAGARSLALIVDDPDAPDPAQPVMTWVHWVVTDLPPDGDGLPEGVDRPPGHVGLNDWNQAAWMGPSPPRGRHRYVFKLYALDRTLELDHATKRDVEHAMRGHVLAEARLTGTYERHGQR